jgi:hypothetical protein
MSISGVFLPAPLLINTARIEKVAGLVNFFAEFFYYENLYVRQELRAIMPTSKFKSRGGKHAANLENIGEGELRLSTNNSRSTLYKLGQ